MPGATCHDGRDQRVETPPPPAPRVAGLHGRVPHGLTQGVDVVHGEAADAGHVGLGGRVVDGEVVIGDAVAVRGPVVSGRRDDGLTLGRHLLEDRLFGRRVAAGVGLTGAPRRRDDRGGVVVGDLLVDVDRTVAVVRALVDLDGRAGRHGRELFDVERRLVVVGAGRSAVDVDRRDGGVESVAVQEGRQVARVVALSS